jgi:hypothetical protein
MMWIEKVVDFLLRILLTTKPEPKKPGLCTYGQATGSRLPAW